MTIFMIQPAPYTDQIIDGHQMTKLPYPIFADETGRTGQTGPGKFVRVIGFQKDLAVNAIDLRWADVVADPLSAMGMYVVVSDNQGDWFTMDTAVDNIEIVGEAQLGKES